MELKDLCLAYRDAKTEEEKTKFGELIVEDLKPQMTKAWGKSLIGFCEKDEFFSECWEEIKKKLENPQTEVRSSGEVARLFEMCFESRAWKIIRKRIGEQKKQKEYLERLEARKPTQAEIKSRQERRLDVRVDRTLKKERIDELVEKHGYGEEEKETIEAILGWKRKVAVLLRKLGTKKAEKAEEEISCLGEEDMNWEELYWDLRNKLMEKKGEKIEKEVLKAVYKAIGKKRRRKSKI
jgi:hypothetical protein